MHILIFFILLLVVLFMPQFLANYILTKHSKTRQDFLGTGGEFAQHLLSQLKMSHVRLETTDSGSHYDPTEKVVRLSKDHGQEKSLTALVVAAHEVGHAIQDQIGYQPFHWRIKLIRNAQTLEKLGAWLMVIMPIASALTHIPAVGVLIFLGGLASLGASVVVHFITLPVEWDASFKRALPILTAGRYISAKDQTAARQILTACALTYVASSLASLLNLWRWFAILRR